MPPARGQVTCHKTGGIRIWAVRGWGSGTPPARTPHTPWGEPHPVQAKRTALADTAQTMRPCPAALAAKGVADTAFLPQAAWRMRRPWRAKEQWRRRSVGRWGLLERSGRRPHPPKRSADIATARKGRQQEPCSVKRPFGSHPPLGGRRTGAPRAEGEGRHGSKKS